MFGVFYLNGRSCLLLGNLESDCIWFQNKEKGAVSERCEMWLVTRGRESAGVLVCVCWHGTLHSDGWKRAQSPWDRMVHRRLVVLQRKQEAMMGSLAVLFLQLLFLPEEIIGERSTRAVNSSLRPSGVAHLCATLSLCPYSFLLWCLPVCGNPMCVSVYGNLWAPVGSSMQECTIWA